MDKKLIAGIVLAIFATAVIVGFVRNVSKDNKKINVLQHEIKIARELIVKLQGERDAIQAERDRMGKAYSLLVAKLSAQAAKKKAIKSPATESEIKQRFERLGYKSR